MEQQVIAGIDTGVTSGCTTMADLKLRVAEHIIAQYGFYGTDEVRNILTETKVGAWRRPALLKRLKMVFEAD
ncbi:MAG: hypothetical protein ACE5LA_01595 [Dehalococcoidales bacterium]